MVRINNDGIEVQKLYDTIVINDGNNIISNIPELKVERIVFHKK